MSTEEKKPLLSKSEGEETTEVPAPRPQVPVVDYSKKTFYDYLGLKEDASKETIKSTSSELLKKYNPVTNPDEIDKYQNVLRSERVLNYPPLKKLYDDYGDLSVLICELSQHYFTFTVEGKVSTHITVMLFTAFSFVLSFFLSIFLCIIRYYDYFEAPHLLVYTPGIVMGVEYLILVLLRSKRELKYVTGEGEVKEKNIKDIKMRDCLSVVKAVLFLLFIYLMAKYFDNKGKGCFFCACLPYILMEVIILYQDFIKFKAGVEGINTGKDVDNYLLRGNTYIKYLIGINNTKCEMNKEGKKGACASLATGLFALNIFKTDALRFAQNVLLFIALNSNPPFYMIFFTPTLLLCVASIGEVVLQGKIGYVRCTHESVLAFAWITAYFITNLDLIFTYFALDARKVDFVTHQFLFLFELLFVCGLLIGVLPFVPIMEFKMKHGETDAPL